MTCARCRRALKQSRVVGYRHADGSYWCDSEHLWHASPDATASVLFCHSIRKRFGF